MLKKMTRKMTKQKKQLGKELSDTKVLPQEAKKTAVEKNMVQADKSLQQRPNQRKHQRQRSKKDQRSKKKPKKETKIMRRSKQKPEPVLQQPFPARRQRRTESSILHFSQTVSRYTVSNHQVLSFQSNLTIKISPPRFYSIRTQLARRAKERRRRRTTTRRRRRRRNPPHCPTSYAH